MLIIGNENSLDVRRAKLLAGYVGKELKFSSFDGSKKSQIISPIFEISSQLPIMQVDGTTLCGGDVCNQFIANTEPGFNLLGNKPEFTANIEQWVNVCTKSLEKSLSGMKGGKGTNKQSQKEVQKILSVMDSHLLTRTYLVGERISYADLAFVPVLSDAFANAFTPEFVEPYVNFVRWYKTIATQTKVIKCCGSLPLVASAKAVAESEPIKKETKPKSKAKDEEEDYGDEEDQPKVVEKNILDSLPPTKFHMDTWKRLYSNSKDRYGEAMTWFWQNYDPEGWSIWYTKYEKLEDECKINYATSNLLAGFLHRIDPNFRKYGFSVMNIIGTEGNYDIIGIWLFRGIDLPNEIKTHPSYDYFTWKKLDHKSDKDKALTADYWCADEEVEGLHIEDCKVYK